MSAAVFSIVEASGALWWVLEPNNSYFALLVPSGLKVGELVNREFLVLLPCTSFWCSSAKAMRETEECCGGGGGEWSLVKPCPLPSPLSIPLQAPLSRMEQGPVRKDCHFSTLSFPQTAEEIEAWRAERRKNYPLNYPEGRAREKPLKAKESAVQKKRPKSKASLIVKLLDNQAEQDAFHLLEIFRFISANQPALLGTN